MSTYDLSHPIETGMQTYPSDPPVAVEPHATFEADGYRVSAVELGSHAGTHVDAPSHTESEGSTLDDVPLETFSFDALRVDVRGREPRAAVGVPSLPEPTDDTLLVLHTGWDEHWGTAAYRDHPYLTPAAAEWCAAHDYHVAVDAPSVDPTPTERATDGEPEGFPAHHALLGADRLLVENLTRLESLPRRFELRAYPLALGGDGAPVRAVGVTD